MPDPSYDIQGAMTTKLSADVTLVGGRVYDAIPPGADFPMIQFGNFQSTDDSADCIDSVDTFVTIHVWSRGVGQVEASKVASQIRTSLHGQSLDLGAAWQFLEMTHRDTNLLRDPDGVTTHAVLTIQVSTTTAE